MFVTENQFYYFAESLYIGALSAFFYSFIALIKLPFKKGFFYQVIDFWALCPCFLCYLILSEKYAFPNFRFYMFVGVVIGFTIYSISFGKTLAKISEIVYNKTNSFIRRKIRDGRKEKKVSCSKHGNVCNSVVFASDSACVSTRFNGNKSKHKKSVDSRKSKA